MNDLAKIILTSAFTVTGGILVFVIGQMIQRLAIEPIQELRKTISQVRFTLLFHAPVIFTPISRTEERSNAAYAALMHSSCDLIMRADAIPFYSTFSDFFQLFPKKSQVIEAAKWLRALSTYVHETDNRANDHIDQVRGLTKKVEALLAIASDSLE